MYTGLLGSDYGGATVKITMMFSRSGASVRSFGPHHGPRQRSETPDREDLLSFLRKLSATPNSFQHRKMLISDGYLVCIKLGKL